MSDWCPGIGKYLYVCDDDDTSLIKALYNVQSWYGTVHTHCTVDRPTGSVASWYSTVYFYVRFYSSNKNTVYSTWD